MAVKLVARLPSCKRAAVQRVLVYGSGETAIVRGNYQRRSSEDTAGCSDL
jgi:hypothetical protein